MGKIAKLVMVTSNNNNKYYDMVENNNVINVTYGRVGQGAMEATYPIGKWNSLYKSKIRKGYKDLTELREVESTIINFDDIDDDIVNKLITELQAFANRSIQQNYTVSSEVVTQKQIDAAQQLLNEITDIFGKRKINLSLIDNKLLELYQVIPRKMKVVNDYLTIGLDQQEINLLIANEQATLDVMKGQVSVNSAQKTNTIENKQTILEAMGIEIYAATEKEIDRIKKELGNAKDRFVRAYSVVNKKTQEKFNNFVEKTKNKKVKMFWHGSRNENWLSILDGGLVLRPTNAVITGKMFGYGLYFADKAQKSIGYTSVNGSYWANGSSHKGYMALYDVHLGNELKKKRWENWMARLTLKELKKYGNYDSFFAEGGADLRNNEYIVYDQDQCTVKYLVEIR